MPAVTMKRMACSTCMSRGLTLPPSKTDPGPFIHPTSFMACLWHSSSKQRIGPLEYQSLEEIASGLMPSCVYPRPQPFSYPGQVHVSEGGMPTWVGAISFVGLCTKECAKRFEPRKRPWYQGPTKPTGGPRRPARKRTNTDDLIQELIAQNKDGVKELFRATLEKLLEAQMTEALSAEPYQRKDSRQGYRAL